MESSDLREELNCSVCLNIYTDPVMLSCGHNFCRVCIGKVLDKQEGAGVYTCPECRAEFQERPALQRNRTLNNIAERFVSTQPKKEEATVFCTYCVQASVPALKTCLQCETSLCDNHLKIHNKTVDHVLIEPTASLKDRKCPIHNEVLKYYCCDDAVAICTSCYLAKEHKGHEVEPLNETSTKKKAKLRNVLEKLTSKRKVAERQTGHLQVRKNKLQEKSAGLTEKVAAMFKDMKKQIKNLEKQILSQISIQEKQCSLQISELIQQLEIESEELARKISHIDELCNMDDPLTVLQGWKSYISDYCDIEGNNEDQEIDCGNISVADELDEGHLSVTIHTALDDFITRVKRKGYVAKSDLLIDVNTSVEDIAVSSDRKSASRSRVNRSSLQKRERFESCQVLSNLSVSSGQHYWELEISDTGIWRIGVAYPSLNKEGDQYRIGDDNKSWCLYMFDKDYSVIHNAKEKSLQLDSHPDRLGIYLDYEAGRISFYQLCDSIKHLYTFTATFTEPLHLVFRVYMDGWLRIRN
ncbi:E3 ubiquitin/ISG15 ligase TRIM25-like [Pelobates fuscus]|uniref:E3 ubiquitin/ISG15 ligase TRIM25-like n=1 Tax=Pelobates fuscus TaxID=191477 RepID=UPI002FE49414